MDYYYNYYSNIIHAYDVQVTLNVGNYFDQYSFVAFVDLNINIPQEHSWPHVLCYSSTSYSSSTTG